jgi:Bacterial inner membrane protein
MEHAMTVAVNNPLAAAAGLAAMVCLVVWPLFRARSTMLITYIGNNLGFAVHYALLGHWTAVVMNGVMGVQTVVAIGLVGRPRLRWLYYALMPVLAGGSLATWQGLPSFLAAAAATLSTIGRMQGNEAFLRAWLLASTPFWLAHDLVVGSLPGLIADLLSMATGATMLLRLPAVRAAAKSALRRVLPAKPFRAPARHRTDVAVASLATARSDLGIMPRPRSTASAIDDRYPAAAARVDRVLPFRTPPETYQARR